MYVSAATLSLPGQGMRTLLSDDGGQVASLKKCELWSLLGTVKSTGGGMPWAGPSALCGMEPEYSCSVCLSHKLAKCCQSHSCLPWERELILP